MALDVCDSLNFISTELRCLQGLLFSYLHKAFSISVASSTYPCGVGCDEIDLFDKTTKPYKEDVIVLKSDGNQ